ALITVGFAAYDTYNYASGKTTGAEYAAAMALNGAALVADVATLGNGGGLAVRAANVGVRVARAVDKANDAYETVNTIIETGQVVANGDSAEISRAVVTAVVEQVVGGGKGKHDVDINANAVSAKKLDGVDPKAAPSAKPIDDSRPQHGTPEHDATAFNEAKKMESQSGNSDARFNQTLTNANGEKVSNLRPDAQVTRTTESGAKVKDVTEVISPTQKPAFMDKKVETIKNILGNEAGEVKWIDPKDKLRNGL
ncbi:MAG: hypothetical protein ACREIA_09310, partial [Opitutaceae bacterium]